MSAEEEVKAVETLSPAVIENDEKIQEALKDPTKKRKAEDEIEIDLKSSIPLSKKQKRLLRRGKISLEELNAKYNIDPASVNEFKTESVSENGSEDAAGKEPAEKLKEEKFGVWIGNLSFDTTREDLMRLILGKTKQNEDSEKIVEEKDIVRFKLPLANNDGKKIKNKGFCYIDFSTEQKMKAVLELNENQLNGRNLLIKNSKSFEGRPDKNDLVSMSKNPPSRILFVGNLSFDTTDDVLKKHFQHCGEIIKIRMATFQDSGKCKGFAFVDFKSEEGATNALKDKTCRRIASRPIRMEYGEDRSKRQVIRKKPMEEQKSFDLPVATKETHSNSVEKKPFKPRNNRNKMMDSNNRVKSSVALAGAQRASAAIVPSQGKKVKFD